MQSRFSDTFGAQKTVTKLWGVTKHENAYKVSNNSKTLVDYDINH